MNIDLHYSVETLDALDSSFDDFLVPSDKFYYGKYAYKAVFATPVYPESVLKEFFGYADNVAANDYFKMQLHSYVGVPREHDDSNKPDYIEEKIITKQPARLTPNHHTLYFKSLNDLKLTINEFKDSVHEIYGPLNKTHYDLLLSKNFRCEVRDRLWYNKYDYRAFMHLPYRASMSYTSDQKNAKMDEIVSFLKENLDTNSLKFFGPHGSSMFNISYRSSFVDFYTRSEEFDKIYPFLTMMFNDWRVVITKAYIK